MSKIRVDGQTMALAHPTRSALYNALLAVDELSTVMLQKSTGVTRYHLYHHLQSLAKNDLVENHRDEGRARWWRVKTRVETTTESTISPPQTTSSGLPAAAQALLDAGAEAHLIEIPGTAADQIRAKKAMEEVAAAFGVELDLPFTFMPNGLLLIGPPRRN